MGSFPYLEVELESKSLTKTASSDAININTNRSVSVTVTSEHGTWLTAAVEGDQLVLDWKENTLEEQRTATILLSTPNSLVTKTINVIQDASGELTFNGDLILRSKEEIATNTYTKASRNLMIGDVISVFSKAAGSSVEVDFIGKVLKVAPSDISDTEITLLNDQIHMIGEGGLAIVNTKVSGFPVELISQNYVNKVTFAYNSMKALPSADVLKALNLKELSVRGNGLTDISSLSGCNSIRVLDISDNDIYDLEPIMQMEELQTVVMDNLPISAPKLEVLIEQFADIEIIADNLRPEDSPLPVFGDLVVTPISDTQVQLTAYINSNASDITKAGFYIGNKRILSDMDWYDATYEDGVLTMVYDVETLENIIYYVRAYAENVEGGDYSKSGFFGSMTSEEDVYISSYDDLQEFYDKTYSHVNGSVFIGRTYTTGTTGIKLDDGKYQMYFRGAEMPDLSKLNQLVYVRDGLYIGNVGLKDLKYIAHIEGMQTLWLRANQFTRVPELAAAPTLTYIDVSMNNLSDIEFLDKLPALETLYLGSSDKPENETNDIGVIDGLSKYTNLKHIDLSGLPLHQWQVDDLRAAMPEAEIVFTSGGKDPHIPTVQVGRVTRNDGSVTMNAILISEGKSDISECGFYYGKDVDNMTKVVAEERVDAGDAFSCSVDIQDLDMYYWYPYAINAQGESRCSMSEFTLAYEDLSQTGTANCYLIQTPGKYKFKATVRGNSTTTVGTPVEAAVVWEFNNPTEWGSVISYVNLTDDGYVEFETHQDVSYGNALIAVKDQNGTIIWSWHIWLCNFDPDASAHKTQSGIKLMDRNLGATLSEFHDDATRLRASGMLYQWGRKDPMSQLTITGWRENFSYQSIEESISEPTIFAQNWTWLDNGRGMSGLWSKEEKTVYDPCPQGWMVADKSPWDNFQVTYYNEFGVKATYGSSSDTVQYPFNPFYDSNFTYFGDYWNGGNIWTSEMASEWNLYNLYYDSNAYTQDRSRNSSDALPVRCMKDVGLIVTTSDVKPAADKATVYGNVRSKGIATVSERGFVYSSTTSTPTIDNSDVVAAGSGEGDFSATLIDLGAETEYWARAYAKNNDGTRYGSVIYFRTAKTGTGGDSFTEDDYVWE